MAKMFEVGHSYIFYHYYGGKLGLQQFSGRIIAYKHPLVKVQTKGLNRIVNCSSQNFIEAIARLEAEEIGALELDKNSESNG